MTAGGVGEKLLANTREENSDLESSVTGVVIVSSIFCNGIIQYLFWICCVLTVTTAGGVEERLLANTREANSKLVSSVTGVGMVSSIPSNDD